jgi:hypothetical protein
VLRLRIQPSEFWKMEPRHFWILAETLEPGRGTGPNLGTAERAEMKAMLEAAQRGEF